MYKYNPTHIMIGGDLNVDFCRTSHNTNILSDFIIAFNLLKSVDLACASVPYTYISHTNATSIIDHFLLSQSLYKDVTSCLIKDNHLFSDHVPVQLSLGIDVEHVSVVERPFVARLAWYKASEQNIYTYKYKPDEQLSNVHINNSILHCNNRFCDQHKDEISTVYNYVINACIIASAHVPKTSSHSNKVTPGWNDNARKLREDALSWHHFWNINGRPKDGHIADMHRVTRARYHREIRHLKKKCC